MSNKKLVIAGGVSALVVVVGITVLLILLLSDTTAEKLAVDIPSNAVSFSVLEDPADMLDQAAEMIPAQLKPLMQAKLGGLFPGFDPLDAASWENFGIDLTQPIGFALIDLNSESFVVSIGSTGADDARQKLTALAMQVGIQDAPQPTTIGDIDALVFEFFNNPVAILFKGDRMLVVGGDRLHRFPGADGDENAGIQLLATQVASAESGTSLADNDAFGDAVSSLPSSDLVTYINFAETLKPLFDRGGEKGQFASMALSETKGLAIGLKYEEGGFKVSARSPLEDNSKILQLLENADLDAGAFDDLPGPALAGAHVAIDPTAALEIANGFLATMGGRDYQQATVALGMLGTNVDALANEILRGDAGFVLAGPLALDERTGVPKDLVGFVGLGDEDQAASLIQTAMGLAGTTGMMVTTTVADDTNIYTLMKRDRPIVALSVYDGRLLMAANEFTLRAVVTGDRKTMWDDDRSADVASAIRDGGFASAFVDLQSLAGQAAPMLQREMSGMWREFGGPLQAALTVFDRGELTAEINGNVLSVDCSVTYDQEKLLNLVNMASGLAGMAGGATPAMYQLF